VLPNATLQTVPRCGHQIMLEAPDVTNAAIEALLAD
jgi:pimeloyl-ACP methyl ester carboxylesterase